MVTDVVRPSRLAVQSELRPSCMCVTKVICFRQRSSLSDSSCCRQVLLHSQISCGVIQCVSSQLLKKKEDVTTGIEEQQQMKQG